MRFPRLIESPEELRHTQWVGFQMFIVGGMWFRVLQPETIGHEGEYSPLTKLLIAIHGALILTSACILAYLVVLHLRKNFTTWLEVRSFLLMIALAAHVVIGVLTFP